MKSKRDPLYTRISLFNHSLKNVVVDVKSLLFVLVNVLVLCNIVLKLDA